MGLHGNAIKGKEKFNHKLGNGQVGGTGTQTQEIVDRTFNGLVKSVKEYKVLRDSVAMAFHPNPTETMIETHKGWVRVGVGEAGFQTNSGMFVKL